MKTWCKYVIFPQNKSARLSRKTDCYVHNEASTSWSIVFTPDNIHMGSIEYRISVVSASGAKIDKEPLRNVQLIDPT